MAGPLPTTISITGPFRIGLLEREIRRGHFAPVLIDEIELMTSGAELWVT